MTSRNFWTAIGTAVGIGGVVGGSLLWSRRASAAPAQGSNPPVPGDTDMPPIDLGPLPRAQDVEGDLTSNWGKTPTDLRPLFMKIENVSRISGSARILAIKSWGESRWVTTAHNGDGDTARDRAERDSTIRAYNDNKDRNPPLRYGEQAANFGSGGLFGTSAPYFLWTGVPEVGDRAPLLHAPPQIVFQPRAAAFGAAVYLQRIIKHYRVDDHADIAAGWASPSLLKQDRGSQRYNETRARFMAQAGEVGIDLADTATIPTTFDASAWPGVLQVFAGLVGTLPKELA